MEKDLSAYKQSLGYQTESLELKQTSIPFHKRFQVEFNREFETVTGISVYTSSNINALIDVKISLEDDFGTVISPVTLKYLNSNPALLNKTALFRDIFRRAQGATAYIVISSNKPIPFDLRLDVTFRLQNGVKHPGWEIDYQQVEILLPTENIQVNYPSGQFITIPKENNIHIQRFTFDKSFPVCIGFSSVFANRFIDEYAFIQLRYQNNIICNKVHNKFSGISSTVPYSQSMFPLQFQSSGKTVEIEIEMKERIPGDVFNAIIPDIPPHNKIPIMEMMQGDINILKLQAPPTNQIAQILDKTLNNFVYPNFSKVMNLDRFIKDSFLEVNNTYYIIFLLKRYVKPSR